MKILMLGIYDIKKYSRGRIIFNGLKKNMIETEIFLPRGALKYLKILGKLLLCKEDVIIVTGKIVFLLSKLLQFFHRKKIIFDVFISDFDNLVKDRKLVKEKSLYSKLLWLSDKYSCLISDLVILDTNDHIKYFIKEFGLSKTHFEEVLIGADENIFRKTKTPKKHRKEFVVFFHGTFIPLQGIKYILDAAKLISSDKSIRFIFAGRGQTFLEMKKYARKLKLSNVNFLGFVKIEKLPSYIEKSDICLGIFGDSEKTQKVIPNKAYEIIASGKPLISGKTPAMEKQFTHGKDVYLCEVSSGKAIADSIKNLKTDKALRLKIGINGYKKFSEKFTSEVIGKKVKEIAEKLLIAK